MVLNDQKILQNIQEVVNYTEDIIHNNHLFVPYKKITIYLKETENFAVAADAITMSQATVKNKIEFGRAFLRSWFLNFASRDVQSDKFVQTIFSDIYAFLFWNQKIQTVSQEKWLKYFYSEKDICNSPSAVLDQRLFCETIQKKPQDLQGASFQSLSIWSLRPFILTQFYQIFENASLAEKASAITQFSYVVSHLEWKRSYDHLNFKEMAKIYNDLLQNIFDQTPMKTAQFKFSFDVETIVAAPPAAKVSVRGNTLLLMDKHTYYNPWTQSVLYLNHVQSKNWQVYTQLAPKLEDLRKLPAERAEVFIVNKDPIKVHLPSLNLLAQYGRSDLLHMDVSKAFRNHQIESILGWNPVQVR